MTPFDNPRKVPFPQWGGSAQYAHRLVDLLPPHDVYVEPFCGAAALFFAKPPASREVLADLDPDVTFTLRYIQQLTPRRLVTLKRYSWLVSHEGQRLAKLVKPGSDSKRFWRHVYCRTATWGAKPTCRGYASINDGNVYDLDQLWKFKARLVRTRIITQDWRETLKQFRAQSHAFFFIDPPYIEEWNISEGVSPEGIAAEVSKLKGHYLIAYTDSARARRAFANSGHQFKLRIMETKRVGVFKKRTRLFVRSWDEPQWLTPKEIVRRLTATAGAAKRYNRVRPVVSQH